MQDQLLARQKLLTKLWDSSLSGWRSKGEERKKARSQMRESEGRGFVVSPESPIGSWHLFRRKSSSMLWEPFFSQYFGRSISPDMLLILANVAPLAQYTGSGFVISSSGFWNSVTFHNLSEFSMSYVKQLFSQVVFPHCFIKCVLEIILLLELQSNLRLRQPLISDQFSKIPKVSTSNHYIWNLM